MKFITIASLALALFALVASAEHCIDLGNTSPVDPTIAASKNKGNLYVKLNSAKGLTDKDLFGKSDPFIEMWLEKAYKHRSKDTKGLNPTFNETFCFYVRAGQDKLYVKAVDKDIISNDKIGQVTIPLSNVFKTGREGPQDYTLPKWFGLRSNGIVNMQMLYQEDTK
ncbi:hypothetical protein EMPS_05346 [Entomortierella parvispora]|uniref:C2 domain-containing protein n=1 Tax=Entomortierella parvispora TaxID=205924 RepID=A0A9P3HAP8_9FUNG|nr:hypothetical protein EMPS_05346 [Entomortierella parvispora]